MPQSKKLKLINNASGKRTNSSIFVSFMTVSAVKLQFILFENAVTPIVINSSKCTAYSFDDFTVVLKNLENRGVCVTTTKELGVLSPYSSFTINWSTC